jgi:1,4-dihydroxy-2-naphthoate octaprenyltransferase
VGTTLASTSVDHLNWLLIVLTLCCSLLIQIGTNLINDALDYKKGADSAGRLGPLRVTQSGLLSFKEVYTMGCLCFALALLCGIPLIFAGGAPLCLVLILSIACGYLYTGGPFPLAYIGFSDVFVFIFFGLVSTSSVFYLQTETLTLSTIVAGAQIGCLAMIPHAINNLRDHRSDALAHKRTIAVRFGVYVARWEITILSFFPFLLGLFWIDKGFLWMAVLPLLAILPIAYNVKSVWNTEPSKKYNELLAKSALCQLLFGGLLAIGHLIG